MRFSLGSGCTVSIHPEGRIFVGAIGALSILAILFGGLHIWSMLLVVLTFVCAGFFRDPNRVVPQGNGLVISPADGRVANIETVDVQPEFGIGEMEMVRISIFLSVFDVHVNRIPVSGKILSVNYVPGKFFNASLDKASIHNERNAIVIESENADKIVFVQIAGLVARRIVSDVEVGSFFAAGDRYGIIRFGSRMDVYIPKSYKLNVLVGQMMIGGETVIATA